MPEAGGRGGHESRRDKKQVQGRRGGKYQWSITNGKQFFRHHTSHGNTPQ